MSDKIAAKAPPRAHEASQTAQKTAAAAKTPAAPIVAIDLGLKRVGVACALGGVSLPLAPIMRQNRVQAARAVSEILRKKGAGVLVIGVADEAGMRRARHFAGLLDFGGEVLFVDENLSSKEAENLVAGRKNAKNLRKNGALDSLAAQGILERFLGRFLTR